MIEYDRNNIYKIQDKAKIFKTKDIIFNKI